MHPAISVVIPTYNRVQLLGRCLTSLLNQSLDKRRFEIIVVDDGSTDETADMITELTKKTTHSVRSYRQENKFSGSARNQGISEASGDIILSMDDDILADPNLLKQHLELHDKYPELEMAVAGRVITGNSGIDLMNPDSQRISSVGDTGNGDRLVDLTHFATGNVSLKRNTIINAGLFTPGLPRLDDTDLAFRLKDRGVKLIYCPGAIGIHMEPLDTLEKVVNSGKRYGQTLAESYRRIPRFQREMASLGARFNGGWHQLIHHPWSYFKDAGRRWAINQYTISSILWLASRIPITNPPSRILVRLSKEIWAYYFRQEFRKSKDQPDRRKRVLRESRQVDVKRA